MATAIHPQQQRQFGTGMPFDHITLSSSPHFTNPWAPSSGPQSSRRLYALPTGFTPNLGPDTFLKQEETQIGNDSLSMSPYSGASITAVSAGGSLLGGTDSHVEMLAFSQDLLCSPRMQGANNGYSNNVSYTNIPSATQNVYIKSSPYDTAGYAPCPVRPTYNLLQHQLPEGSGRLSQQSMGGESTRSFGDAVEAGQGMVAMSQNSTPRNIYGLGLRTGRGSGDSYGFPATHSTSSSISSTGNYSSYFGGSIDSSVSDYSGAGSDMESVSSRTLPRPSGILGGNMPPAAQSMMGQFSAKVSSSTQKKHKCKVCDKRFTRPSSLQTHIYSHTGEKPFSCAVVGCGRHFSVVSNLRRHRRVHRSETRSEPGSDHPND